MDPSQTQPQPRLPAAAPPAAGGVLSLTLTEGALAGGEVPVAVLAQKLLALQNLLYHAAASVDGNDGSRLGHWANRYRKIAEVTFKQTRPGSLVVETALPENDTLFEQQKQTVNLAFDAVAAAAAGNFDRIPRKYGRDERVYLLRAAEELCPFTLDDYAVVLSNGRAGHAPVRLTSATRKAIRDMVVREQAPRMTIEAERVVVGHLVQLNVDSDDRKIVLRVSTPGGGVLVPCYYPTSLRDQVANLVGGSLVEVRGSATLTTAQQLQSISDVYSVEMVDTDPIQLASLVYGGTRYSFAPRAAFDVEYVDGLWVYSSDLLNVSGFAPSREAALNGMAESLDYAWHEIAQANDSELEEKALELKRRMLTEVTSAPLNAEGH